MQLCKGLEIALLLLNPKKGKEHLVSIEHLLLIKIVVGEEMRQALCFN